MPVEIQALTEIPLTVLAHYDVSRNEFVCKHCKDKRWPNDRGHKAIRSKVEDHYRKRHPPLYKALKNAVNEFPKEEIEQLGPYMNENGAKPA